MKNFVALIIAFLMCLPAQASGFTFPITFVAHAPLLASQLNSNFSSAATALTSGGNGFIPVGNSGGTYTSVLPTSTGSTIVFTPGSGTLSADVASTLIQHATVNVTSANLLAMYATPVQLIAAPAVGTNIVVYRVMFTMTTTGTAYAAGGAVHFQINNTAHGAGADTCDTVAAAVITAGAGTSYSIQKAATYTGTAATGLFISNDTAAFTTGTGTAVCDIWYAIQ